MANATYCTRLVRGCMRRAVLLFILLVRCMPRLQSTSTWYDVHYTNGATVRVNMF